MTENTDTKSLEDLMQLAISGGIAIVAFAIAAIIWKIADTLGVNPFTEESSPIDGEWGLNWPDWPI